jgi:periplasmic divalent cation tolerance protein
MESSLSLVVVLVTAPDEELAVQLARTLVQERIVACAQILPGLTSYYSWENKLECSGEVLLILKARQERLAALDQRVRELHPHEVPQIVALPACHVEEHYARWVMDVTDPAPEGDAE